MPSSRSLWSAAVATAISLPALAAGPTPWNLELARGRTARTTVTVANRCHATHAFEVAGDPAAPWIAFPEAASVSPAPGASLTVPATVDTRALDPGEHRATISVRCLDCESEPLCSQNRDVFDARLKVLWSEEDLASWGPEAVFPGEFLAILAEGTERSRIEKAAGVRWEGSFDLPTIRTTVVRLRTTSSGRAAGEVVRILQKDAGVRLAQPNFLYRTEQESREDPYRQRQYALDLLGLPGISARATGRGVLVAVLDSFVQTRHPDLPGAVAGSADFFTRGVLAAGETHGSAMTGIIAAKAHNGIGIAGIAPDASVLAIRVCGSLSPGAHEVCSTEALARGIDYAIAKSARVANMSLAGTYDALVARVAYKAVDSGIVLVAATGNEGLSSVQFPAALPPVIAVNAIDANDRSYESGNYGSRVDVVAPGVDIFTLAAPSGFGPTTGTSPAAAEVSGVVALLLELKPGLTPEEVRTLLKETARPLESAGRRERLGAGAVDACRAASKLTGNALRCR
jgi:subtilisin family serine protease